MNKQVTRRFLHEDFRRILHDNIEPTELGTPPSKEYKELLQLICRNEAKLQATFTDEQKGNFHLEAKMMLTAMEE